MARLLAALSYGERVAAGRARSNLQFAPNGRAREEQTRVAEREEENSRLMEARLAEVGSPAEVERFRPFFDAFFERTEPTDCIEAQTWHYVGDALVSDFGEGLMEVLDPVSTQIIRRTLGDRQDQESFALDELKRAMDDDPRCVPTKRPRVGLLKDQRPVLALGTTQHKAQLRLVRQTEKLDVRVPDIQLRVGDSKGVVEPSMCL